METVLRRLTSTFFCAASNKTVEDTCAETVLMVVSTTEHVL